jgi:ferritin-like metal-binding protein YciE
MAHQDLFDLFHHKLREMWFAEKKIRTALPKMANAAKSDALRAAFRKHEGETDRQMARLGEVFALIDKPAKEESSIGLQALIDGCMEAIVKFKDSSAQDAACIAAAQVVEHYEIACYGALKAWAEQLEMEKAAGLLDESLTEEKNTDEALTHLAEDIANPRSQKDGDGPRRRTSHAA